MNILNNSDEQNVNWLAIEADVRKEQARFSREMAIWIGASIRRLIKAPASLFSGRVATN